MATKCAFNQLRGEIIPNSHMVPLYSKKKKKINGHKVSLLLIKTRKKTWWPLNSFIFEGKKTWWSPNTILINDKT